ncbi:MAG: ABC transporter substrate-binding protein [bacterium]
MNNWVFRNLRIFSSFGFGYLDLLLVTIVLLCSTGTIKAQKLKSDSNIVTVTDIAGRTVSFKQPIKRIVLIFGKEIYDLSSLLGDEIEDKLVGWGPALKTSDNGAYIKFIERFPRLQKTSFLGSYHNGTLTMEQLLALKPDLVITGSGPRNTIEQIEKTKLPYLVLGLGDLFKGKVQNLGIAHKSLLILGKVLGKEQKAKEITDFVDSHMDTIFSRLSRIKSPVPSVYLENATSAEVYGGTEVYRYGNAGGFDKLSYWSTMLEQVRCNNIAANTSSEDKSYFAYMGQINPEYLLKADPDVIILVGTSGFLNFPTSIRVGYDVSKSEALSSLEAFTKRPGWENLKAVKNCRVYALSFEFLTHSMGFVGLEQIAKWLYPNEFKDIDPEEDLREFHKRFMPIEYSGVWMIGLEDK